MRTVSVILIGIFLFIFSVDAQTSITSETETITAVPVISWEEQTLDMGAVTKGDSKDMAFHFRNTGEADLIIELVTACRCTALDWPREPIPPGRGGTIQVTYDSSTQDLGARTKTIDIIANTDPIVVEAFFKVEVIE